MKVELGKRHFVNVSEFEKFLNNKDKGLSDARLRDMRSFYSRRMRNAEKSFAVVEIITEENIPNSKLVLCIFRQYLPGEERVMVPSYCLREDKRVTAQVLPRSPAGRFEGNTLSA
ncbi:hypothetical protein AUJ77_01700 [Candidatus Nomurabacteria bacterium CG1_02_43_90]|uniref:Uncharacterized protein n=1 Tax=Candidatus Nomurabacteria bacterium CG1_02_43_90 TaxID=1805281 RepID=A0A1J4V6D9_9BACT|nr:MAG: hypothetical protein AUJ77_01700 [Candidatus Nomurabacteria bacterium CG1_02_43_90]